MRAIVVIATLVIDLVVAVAAFLFLLLALNGFNESDAFYGMAAFILFAAVTTILVAFGAGAMAGWMTKRGSGAAIFAPASITVFVVIGAILKLPALAVGGLVAELARQYR